MRIHELTLATHDLAGQRAFWGQTLGLPVREWGELAIEVLLQASTIRFEQSAVVNPRYHFAINVPRGSIHDAAAWIEERHELLAFHGDPDVEEGATTVHTDRGASALYFLDAGCNVAELIANDHLDNDSHAAFGPDSLLEVAEIGGGDRGHRRDLRRDPRRSLGRDPLGRSGGMAADGDRRRPRRRHRRPDGTWLDSSRPPGSAVADDHRRLCAAGR
jgi:catechol 2,3-dioxygenase-like lactoylglutathione lyase family enzyme